jgi:glycosyltransferase involved in cell wall biosynthesis
MLRELHGKIDLSRVHFTGRIAYRDYVSLLQVSSAHVYLTYPFVLSWSLLEAMSAACPVVASRTPPVEEVIAHGRNGLLADFFSPADIARCVDDLLRSPDQARALGDTARRTAVERYDLSRVCLPQQVSLVAGLLARRAGSRRPPEPRRAAEREAAPAADSARHL